MKIILTLVVVLFLSTTLFSQVVVIDDDKNTQPKDSTQQYKFNIGAAGGFVTGPGISYRQWLNLKYGFQFTILPYYKSTKEGDDIDFNVSGLALRILNETKWLNLLGYAGLRFQYLKRPEYMYPTVYDKEKIIQAGFGPGVELKILRVSLNLMVGLRGLTNFESHQEINISVESCAFYRF